VSKVQQTNRTVQWRNMQGTQAQKRTKAIKTRGTVNDSNNGRSSNRVQEERTFKYDKIFERVMDECDERLNTIMVKKKVFLRTSLGKVKKREELV